MADCRELEYLVQLLDVQSLSVRRRVAKALSRYGDCLPELLAEEGLVLGAEQAYELNEILRKKRLAEAKRYWWRWLEVEDPDERLEKAFLSLARYQPTPVSCRPAEESLNALAQEYQDSGRGRSVRSLAEFLFKEKGFQGAGEDYYNPLNGHLGYVLKERRGLPISLVLVMIFVGRRLGIAVRGVNLPGHFMAAGHESGKLLVFDCFNRGRVLDADELSGLTVAAGRRVSEYLHVAPNPEDVVQRMLVNLVNAYQKAGLPDGYHFMRALLEQLKGKLKKSGRRHLTKRDQVSRKPVFKSGEIVRHSRYGYRGVIVDFDDTFMADDEWYRVNGIEPNRNQPWYHILVDGSNVTTYAAQANLEYDGSAREVRHPLISVYFEGFKEGSYLRNDVPWEGA